MDEVLMGCVWGRSKEFVGILKISKIIWIGAKNPRLAGYMQRKNIIYRFRKGLGIRVRST
jgi:hypothetical protein